MTHWQIALVGALIMVMFISFPRQFLILTVIAATAMIMIRLKHIDCAVHTPCEINWSTYAQDPT